MPHIGNVSFTFGNKVFLEKVWNAKEIGNKFGNKSMVPKNAMISSRSPLGVEIRLSQDILM